MKLSGLSLAAAFVAAAAFVPASGVFHISRVASIGVALAAEGRPDLSGTWVLNKDLGSDPAGELETARPRRPVGPGGMGAPVGGAGVGGPLIGGQRRTDRMNAEEMARVKELLRQTMAASERITVAVDGSVIEVTSADGTVRRLHTDGKKYPERSYPGLQLERKTRWKGEELVSELELHESEAKARQTWKREGTRLRVVTKLEPPNGADPLEVLRVYELQP